MQFIVLAIDIQTDNALVLYCALPETMLIETSWLSNGDRTKHGAKLTLFLEVHSRAQGHCQSEYR